MRKTDFIVLCPSLPFLSLVCHESAMPDRQIEIAYGRRGRGKRIPGNITDGGRQIDVGIGNPKQKRRRRVALPRDITHHARVRSCVFPPTLTYVQKRLFQSIDEKGKMHFFFRLPKCGLLCKALANSAFIYLQSKPPNKLFAPKRRPNLELDDRSRFDRSRGSPRNDSSGKDELPNFKKSSPPSTKDGGVGDLARSPHSRGGGPPLSGV